MASATLRTPSPLGRGSPRRAPNAPLWGPRYDDQDIGGSRRSRRHTSNPFSSANAEKAKTPERTLTSVDHMPSPPDSPSQRRDVFTPKSSRSKKTARFASHINAPSSQLLTPAKTPRHTTPPSTGRSRTLVFQHADPGDAMPTPRRMKNTRPRASADIFAGRRGAVENFEIHTDWNARRPKLDLSEDNAFIGERTPSKKQRSRARHTSPRPLEADMSPEEMNERVSNDEGMIFTFRGKKVFRPYEDTLVNTSDAELLGYRPMRRSTTKPALLDFGRLPGRAPDTDEEEAVTDIDTGNDDGTLPALRTSPRAAKRISGSSAFADWPRTKPEGARSSRKREGEESGPSSVGAAKRAKNLL